MIDSGEVLKFWFEEAGPARWFAQSDSFDALIRARFEDAAMDCAAALMGNRPHAWEAEPDSALALIIMLDQFPRNMYRGTKAMFAWDALALGAAGRAIGAGHDYKTAQGRRVFIYLPYMHSENISDQNLSVEYVDGRINSEAGLHHAKQHRRMIERFGRFCHRNEVLGRKSTPEEIAYLKGGNYRL
ncbi:MAG: DUF924 family protein [Robiginitomaculum sp.]